MKDGQWKYACHKVIKTLPGGTGTHLCGAAWCPTLPLFSFGQEVGKALGASPLVKTMAITSPIVFNVIAEALEGLVPTHPVLPLALDKGIR
jgi:hypothetical protein